MATKKQIEYINEWNKANTRTYRMILNKKSEAVIIRYMETKKPKSEYLKALVKKDMADNGNVKNVYMLDVSNNAVKKYLDSKKDVNEYLQNLIMKDMIK